VTYRETLSSHYELGNIGIGEEGKLVNLIEMTASKQMHVLEKKKTYT